MTEPAYKINPCDRHYNFEMPHYFFNGKYHILECAYCNVGFGYEDIDQLIERWNNERPIMPRVRVWSQSKITGIEEYGPWLTVYAAECSKKNAQQYWPDFDYWLEYEDQQ